jgi:hypothetical protein
MKGEGALADLFKDVFRLACRRAGIGNLKFDLSAAAFRRPGETPMLLFE